MIALPMRVVGRAEPSGEGMICRQWPGSYVDTRFRGLAALFRVGAGEVSLRVTVDAGEPITLVRPALGLYRVGPLAPGEHHLRVQAVSASQADAIGFGGFLAPRGVRALPTRACQIEFIGDSHRVGYANRSNKAECTRDGMWKTTDTARELPGVLAGRYRADYRVHAISGRGVVRDLADDAAIASAVAEQIDARGDVW